MLDYLRLRCEDVKSEDLKIFTCLVDCLIEFIVASQRSAFTHGLENMSQESSVCSVQNSDKRYVRNDFDTSNQAHFDGVFSEYVPKWTAFSGKMLTSHCYVAPTERYGEKKANFI